MTITAALNVNLRNKILPSLCALACSTLLSGCLATGSQRAQIDMPPSATVGQMADAGTKVTPAPTESFDIKPYMENGKTGYYKIGKPYKIEGTWYYPKEQPAYDKIGMASWYGPNFHGGLTANGEIYDQDSLSAAHQTLPLPSMVRVTNLENGRTLIVKVNDRGPYSKGRVIDVSSKASELLGFKQNGTAKVRVQFLPGHTQQLLAQRAEQGGGEQFSQAASRLSGVTGTTTVAAAPVAPVVVETQASVEPYAAKEVASAAVVSTAPVVLQGAEEEEAAVVASMEPAAAAPVSAPMAATMASEEEVAPVAIPAVAKAAPASSGTDYFIQAGAFEKKNNASHLADRLLSYGSTSVTPINARNKTFYRVRLGPINNKQQADKILSELKSSGHKGAVIVASN